MWRKGVKQKKSKLLGEQANKEYQEIGREIKFRKTKINWGWDESKGK